MTDTLSEKVARLERELAEERKIAAAAGCAHQAAARERDAARQERDDAIVAAGGCYKIVELERDAARADLAAWKRRAEEAEVERSALGRDLTEVLDWFRHPAFSKRDLIVDSHHNRTDIKMTWLEYGVGIPPKVMDAIQGPRTTQDAPTPPPASPKPPAVRVYHLQPHSCASMEDVNVRCPRHTERCYDICPTHFDSEGRVW